MSRYCKVTNITTRICSTTVQTRYYRSIRLNPNEEVFIREEVCNKVGLEALGFQVELVNFPDMTDLVFGEAHDRILNSIFEPGVEFTSWFPSNGYPTWQSVGYEFPAGTIFESSSVTTSIIDGDPDPISIEYRQRIQNVVRNPDGVTNSQWIVLPRLGTSFATLDDIETAIEESESGTETGGTGTGMGTGTEDVDDYFQTFSNTDFINGELSIPQTTHRLNHISGRPYEVKVFDSQGSEVWICTATNPVTGEVTVSTDGLTFSGSIIISED